jgi:hypothetical protein
MEAKMKLPRQYRAAQIVSSVLLAMICLHFGADPARAGAPDANPVVIGYLNDPGFVPSFEIADALGFFKEKSIRIQSEGIRRAVHKVWPRWGQARSMQSASPPLR